MDDSLADHFYGLDIKDDHSELPWAQASGTQDFSAYAQAWGSNVGFQSTITTTTSASQSDMTSIESEQDRMASLLSSAGIVQEDSSPSKRTTSRFFPMQEETSTSSEINSTENQPAFLSTHQLGPPTSYVQPMTETPQTLGSTYGNPSPSTAQSSNGYQRQPPTGPPGFFPGFQGPPGLSPPSHLPQQGQSFNSFPPGVQRSASAPMPYNSSFHHQQMHGRQSQYGGFPQQQPSRHGQHQMMPQHPAMGHQHPQHYAKYQQQQQTRPGMYGNGQGNYFYQNNQGHDRKSKHHRNSSRNERIGQINATIEKVLQEIKPSEQETANRKLIVERLQEMVSTEWQGSEIKIFGSGASCFALKGADLDACLFINEEIAKSTKLDESMDMNFEYNAADRTKPGEGRHASDKWQQKQEELEQERQEKAKARIANILEWTRRIGAQIQSQEEAKAMVEEIESLVFDKKKTEETDSTSTEDQKSEPEVPVEEKLKHLFSNHNPKSVIQFAIIAAMFSQKRTRRNVYTMIDMALTNDLVQGEELRSSVQSMYLVLNELTEERDLAPGVLASICAYALATGKIKSASSLIGHPLVKGLDYGGGVHFVCRTIAIIKGRYGSAKAAKTLKSLMPFLQDVARDYGCGLTEEEEEELPTPEEALEYTLDSYELTELDETDETPGLEVDDEASFGKERAKPDNSWKEKVIMRLAQLLIKAGMTEVFPIPRARVPIVRFTHPDTNMSCDIGLNNELAVRNTGLLNFYGWLDKRVVDLALIVKRWAKARDINTPFKGTLSSYAYVILVIYFLQTRTPPVLPPLQQIRPPNADAVTIGEWDVYYCDDKKVLEQMGFTPESNPNQQSIGALLIDFFRFYAHDFDYREHVISIRHGKPLFKNEKEWTARHNTRRDRFWWCIEDPFETSHNLGRVADRDSLYCMRGEFMRAAQVLLESGDLSKLLEAYVDGEPRGRGNNSNGRQHNGQQGSQQPPSKHKQHGRGHGHQQQQQHSHQGFHQANSHHQMPQQMRHAHPQQHQYGQYGAPHQPHPGMFRQDQSQQPGSVMPPPGLPSPHSFSQASPSWLNTM